MQRLTVVVGTQKHIPEGAEAVGIQICRMNREGPRKLDDLFVQVAGKAHQDREPALASP